MGMARRAKSSDVQSMNARRGNAELPKGVPVAGLRGHYRHGGWRGRRAGKPSGVSANERLLSHRYMDEGDNGPKHRKMIRRVSERFWRKDWSREQ